MPSAHDLPAPFARDCRLDLVRGLALLVIFVNHIPGNEGQFFTPSRYGWSDAAEVFVFCSGYVSALVFGHSLARSGIWLGTIRVLQRCARIYAVHLALFAALALTCLAGNALFPGYDYIRQLNIQFFFDQTHIALPALVTLRYLPNAIDILPMYLIMLAWLPVFWALSRVNRGLAVVASISLYAATYLANLELSAEPFSDRSWFFNPFSWQLLFFGGYALGAGWAPIRLGHPLWLKTGLALAMIAIPLAHEASLRPLAGLNMLHDLIEPLYEKTRLGPLRILHFAALGYVVASLLSRFPTCPEWPFARRIRILGQHSLAIFALGLLFARMAGMALDQWGHDPLPLMAINLGGMTLLLMLAQGLEWLEGKPWKRAREPFKQALSGAWWRLGLDEFRDRILRPVAIVLLLLPLAVTPFLLPKKPTPVPISSPKDPWRGAEHTYPDNTPRPAGRENPSADTAGAGLSLAHTRY